MHKNQKGFGVAGILLIVAVVGLAGFAGWTVHSHQISVSGIIPQSTPGSERILTHVIPRTDCKNVKPKIQSKLTVIRGGDICYAGPIQAGSEKVEYLILTQSADFQKKAQQEEAKNCTMDCGFGVPITRQDFIVRANGAVEHAQPEWSGSADIAVEELTGCPLGNLDKYENQAKFIVEGGRIGVHFAGKDINYSGRYGSSCKVDMDVVAFTASGKPSLMFKSLGAHYNLADPSVCAQQDRASEDQCYSDQAGMRGDLSICNHTLHPTLGSMSGECVKAVAVRKLDASICKNDDQTSQCEDLVAEHKSYFSDKLVTTGL